MSRSLAVDVLSRYIKFSPGDADTLEKAFAVDVPRPSIQTTQMTRTIQTGNIDLNVADGIKIWNPITAKPTIQLDRTGSAYFGADLTNPAYTSMVISSQAQIYNKESLGRGDLLVGDNSDGKPNLFWDNSEGTLNFRSGQDTKLYIDTAGDLILTGRIASANYANDVSGFEIDAESGDAEFNNVNLRGSLTAVTFVYDNRHALGGTLSLTKAASTFYEDTDLNATDVATSNCKINNDLSGNSLFVLNDNAYVSFWNGTSILSGYIEITSVGANQGEYTVYELTARTGAVGGNTVPADTPVSNYGQTGDSRILLIGGANANINFSEMTTTRVLSARGRFGDLDGVLGISSTTWGFAVGDLGAGSKKYFKATASEVALRGASFATYDSGGVASMYIVADDSRGWGTETLNAGDVCIGYPGTTSYMLWDRSAGILYFKNSSKATQLYVHATDGTLRGGSGGVLKIGSSGISLSVSDSFYQDASYNFTYSDVVIGSLAALHQDLVGTTINLLLSTTKYAGHDCYVSAYADCATTRYSVGTFGAYYNTTVSTSAFMQSTASSSSRTIALKIDNTTELTAYAGYIGVNSLHVGGTSDPGDNNLWVDGYAIIYGTVRADGAVKFPATTATLTSGGALDVTGKRNIGIIQYSRATGGANIEDLITINGGSDGQVITLYCEYYDEWVKVVDNTGNIYLDGSADFTMSAYSSRDNISLMYIKGVWVEIGRGNIA